MKVKNKYSSKQKVNFVLESMQYPDGISAYCRKSGIKESLIYKWKKQIIEHSNNLFLNIKQTNKEKQLEEELNKKDKIISSLVEENIELKKNFGI